MSTVKRSGLKLTPSKLENGIMRGLILSGNLVAQTATQKAPRDTGRLKRSITRGTPFKMGTNTYGVEVGTNVEYARAQEFGSGIHSEDASFRNFIKIVPNKAKVLAFKWPGAPSGMTAGPGGLFFFKSVNHPGVKPQPYLRPALAKNKGMIRKLIYASIIGAMTNG